MNITCVQQVSKLMGTTVKSMSSAMKGMEVEQIAKTMSEFEKQFENMDVRSGTSERSSIAGDCHNFSLFFVCWQHDYFICCRNMSIESPSVLLLTATKFPSFSRNFFL